MIQKATLQNGIRVIAEPMENYRSVSMGVWVGAGSIYEDETIAGVSHFIEHMLFKGTSRRTAGDIAGEMDALGGNLNAFTAKECTCFYAKVLDEHMRRTADILEDLVRHAKLDAEDIAREKGVVCEEILMMQDSPEDLVHEALGEAMYGQTPLGKPILGSESSVRALTREDIGAYMARRYRPDNMVIACAGHFVLPQLVDMLNEVFAGGEAGLAQKEALPQSRLIEARRFTALEKDVEQVHLCLGFPGFAADTKEHFALLLLNNALGGSMSSRLFQSIREERGMAYSVYSYPSAFCDTGYFALYAGTGEKQAAEVAELMLAEAAKVKAEGITPQEFKRAKEQLKGSYMLSQESTSARSGAIGRSELLRGRAYEEEDMLLRIEEVRMEDVAAILPTVLDTGRMACTVIGRAKQHRAVQKVIDKA
ncbi:MAG: insulinase family protein [Christensenellaceae bacterium]|jgi:predicted Zn-dependent peptidase|nr:insulinase family protein [Christensenellaceae bacterium]